MTIRTRLRTAAVLGGALLGKRPRVVHAQIPVDSREGIIRVHDIFHEDGTKVGEIYVDRQDGAATYAEHWVVSRDYAYPHMIRPSENRYDSAEHFLTTVTFDPGSTYIRVDATESNALPTAGSA